MKRIVPARLWGDLPAQLAYLTKKRADGCWEYVGYILPTGYGQLGRNIGAHRIAWEVANGRPVPAGLVIDHTCHNADLECSDDATCRHRRCVNPDHLEAVTSYVNVMRGHGWGPGNAAKTECEHGHDYTEANTYRHPETGKRQCRLCRRQRNAAIVLTPEIKARRAECQRIRAWARNTGLPVRDRGAIPATIRAAYDVAHGSLGADAA